MVPIVSDAHRQPLGRRVRQRRLTAVVVGTAVTIGAAVLAAQPVHAWERDVFRSINSLSHRFEPLAWPLQQLGMAAAIPVAAVILGWQLGSWRRPLVLLALSASLGWGLANVVRELVGRERPAAIMDDVQLGFDVPSAGAAMPSGHAIVAFTIVSVFAPHVGRRTTALMAAVAGCVGLVRVYVGAHMPLDVLAGAAFGVAIGTMVNLVADLVEPRTERNAAP